jgi:hypothetical protein
VVAGGGDVPAATRSPGWARPNGSGRRSRNAADDLADPGHQCTTTWWPAGSPHRRQTLVADRHHRTSHRGKLNLCATKDVYSGWIVGYSIDERMKASLAVTALRNAAALRRPTGTLIHSDRGSPSPVTHIRLSATRQQPGRLDGPRRGGRRQRGHESWFALLQRNVLDRQRWTTRHDLRLAIVTWIERTHHHRRQDRLGRLTRSSLKPPHRSTPLEVGRTPDR